MNKTYRSVWNESTGAWVAVQENVRARGNLEPAFSQTALIRIGNLLCGGHQCLGVAAYTGERLSARQHGQQSTANQSFLHGILRTRHGVPWRAWVTVDQNPNVAPTEAPTLPPPVDFDTCAFRSRRSDTYQFAPSASALSPP
nr:ESPR domain-containing protein [Paraburkholderia acidiphila]